jgi:hypothetical protein
MAHTYEELKHKQVEELREIAKGLDHEAVKGFTQMNKDHLLPALCKALGIESHAHHQAVGLNKVAVKKKIRELQKERAKALEAHDRKQLKLIRRQIHTLNHRIRAASV